MKLNRIHLWLTAAVWCATSVSAAADVTVADLQVAARALAFMENPPKGTVRVGIVYSALVRPSLSQAEGLKSLLSAGLKAGNVDLRAVAIEASEIGTADVDLFFLTDHLGSSDVPLSAVSASRKIPCITADIAQVRAGACTIGVQSKPKIQVYVNREAARASGTSFATAFRVMVAEL